MVAENEITFSQFNNRETITTWALKLVITITTIFLVILVLIYHRLDLALYANKNHSNKWYIGLTWTKILLIVLELIVCAVHPAVTAFPREYNSANDNGTVPVVIQHSADFIPWDAALSLASKYKNCFEKLKFFLNQ